MSGEQTQLGRLRNVREAGSLPWRDGDGWLNELKGQGLIEIEAGRYLLTERGHHWLKVFGRY